MTSSGDVLILTRHVELVETSLPIKANKALRLVRGSFDCGVPPAQDDVLGILLRVRGSLDDARDDVRVFRVKLSLSKHIFRFAFNWLLLLRVMGSLDDARDDVNDACEACRCSINNNRQTIGGFFGYG